MHRLLRIFKASPLSPRPRRHVILPPDDPEGLRATPEVHPRRRPLTHTQAERTVRYMNNIEHFRPESPSTLSTALLLASSFGLVVALMGGPLVILILPTAALIAVTVFRQLQRRCHRLRIFQATSPTGLDPRSRARLFAAAIDEPFRHSWYWSQAAIDPENEDPALSLVYQVLNRHEHRWSDYTSEQLVADVALINENRHLAHALARRISFGTSSSHVALFVLVATANLTRYVLETYLPEDLFLAVFHATSSPVCTHGACDCFSAALRDVETACAAARLLATKSW